MPDFARRLPPIAVLTQRLRLLSLPTRFMLASLLILVGGMIGVGWWVGDQIAAGVVHQTAATTALYVDSFLSPQFRDIGGQERLSEAQSAMLSQTLGSTALGQRVVALKIWGRGGRLLYSSTAPHEAGLVQPVSAGLRRAWSGAVVSGVSSLDEPENAAERGRWSRLLETYSPVRRSGTDDITVVAEFYQLTDDLDGEVLSARLRSWAVVGLVTAGMYMLLGGFVRQTGQTIGKQERALRDQVSRLQGLLTENQALQQRVRAAAARSTALNERLLRRVSAEMHDGLAQEISLALLQLDRLNQPAAPGVPLTRNQDARDVEVEAMRETLQQALREVRSISAGLGLPQLDQLSLNQLLEQVALGHERRTGTKVRLTTDGLPDQAPPDLKTTAYRVTQEALTNAFRHAGGKGQAVRAWQSAGRITIEISDEGPGFTPEGWDQSEVHLGLVGMRDRVESMGGMLWVDSSLGQGTRVFATLPLHASTPAAGA